MSVRQSVCPASYNIRLTTKYLCFRIKKTEGMRARRLLEEFKNCDEDQFNAITDALEKENQSHLAKLLKKPMDEITDETEVNTGSDFIGIYGQ